MKALITGSMGFIGRHFWRDMPDRGWSVDVCDTRCGSDAMDLFQRSVTRYDLVVHAAARSPHRAAIDGQPATLVYNQLLDAAMFDWAIRTGQKHLLYLSSCAAADETPDGYGLLKLTGERLAEQARAAGIAVTVVRPYSGYGEDQSEDFPFGAFAARARRREDPFVIWGDGTQVRDWIHIDDIVGASLALVSAGHPGPVALCSGEGISVARLAWHICTQAGYRPRLDFRLDKPAGADWRVGDPAVMREFYTPTVSLEQGVKRALEVTGVGTR